jgi:hypothetical protein
MEETMPGFFDKLKSGADKAAFEADRLLRVNQAQSTLRALQRDLETETAGLGREVLALYDAGTLTQPELLALCPNIDALREKIATQEAEVERIRQEKPPEAPAPAQEKPAEPPQPVQASPALGTPAETETPAEPAAPGPQGRACPNCGTPLPADVRFCPECGTKLTDI